MHARFPWVNWDANMSALLGTPIHITFKDAVKKYGTIKEKNEMETIAWKNYGETVCIITFMLLNTL